MSRSILLLFFFFGWLVPLSAQDGVQLARVQYQRMFPGKGQLNESTFKGAFTIPIPMGEKWALVAGFRPEQLDWEYARLSQTMIQFGLNRSQGDRDWQVLALWRRNKTEDLETEPVDQWGIWALYKWRSQNGLKWGLGTYVNRERFGWLVVPLVYIDWKISDRWRAYGNLPITARIGYSVTEQFSTGLAFFGLASSYDDQMSTYIERRSNELTLFAEYQLWKGFFADLRFGMALGRQYGRFDQGDEMDLSLSLLRFGDDRTPYFETSGSVPILELGLTYRLMR